MAINNLVISYMTMIILYNLKSLEQKIFIKMFSKVVNSQLRKIQLLIALLKTSI